MKRLIIVGEVLSNPVTVGVPVEFGIQLGEQPADDVIVTITSVNNDFTPNGPFTFTSTNWNTCQKVVLQWTSTPPALGNNPRYFDTVTYTTTSSDDDYNGIVINKAVQLIDSTVLDRAYHIKTSPEGATRVRSNETAATERQILIDKIWPSGDFPTSSTIANKETGFVSDGTFDTSIYTGLLKAEKWTIEVSRGFELIIYKLVPTGVRKNIAFVAPYGHTNFQQSGPNEDFFHQQLLDKKYDVYTGFMIVLGSNPNSDTPPYSTWNGHNNFKNEDGSGTELGLAIFLEPWIVLNNHLATLSYNDLYMGGISGGGWTINWIAALDEKVTYSFPVAPSVPQELEIGIDRDITYDYEQGHYDATSVELQLIYDQHSYMDLYLMATSNGRIQQMQTKVNDSCCFFGWRYWMLVDLYKYPPLWGGQFVHVFHSDYTTSTTHAFDSIYVDNIFQVTGDL